VKKGGHAGAHGGSWKVGYADFMTAMMAFFLLLWLVSMVAPEKRARVAHYFKHFSMFDKSGDTMLDAHKSAPAGAIMGEDGMQKASQNPVAEPEEEEIITPEKRFKQALEEKVEQELGDQKDQVLVSAFDGGVRIELVDSDSSPMFARGRSEITAEGRKVLKVIGENLLTSGKKIALEGHTDAFNYASKQYSNWELSTERASAARKELEASGLPAERLLRVAGFAATEPLIKEDPFDPRNRRISIVVFEQQALPLSVPEDPRVRVSSNSATVEPRPSSLSILEDPRFRSSANPAAAEPRSSSSNIPEDPSVRTSVDPAADPYALPTTQVRKKIPIDPVHQYLFAQ
jgi:chemotaxis protein MotB